MKSDSDRPKPLWAGRLQGELDAAVVSYTSSLHLDRRLALYDLRGTEAHVRMLHRQGLLSDQDQRQVLEALGQIRQEIQSGQFPYREELEDIHMNVESRLHALAGEAGQRVHTGRSRNDQVLVDVKLFCLDTAAEWQAALARLLEALLARARNLETAVLPAWTHMQSAQVISWAHYLLAFCEMFRRDFQRLNAYRQLHDYSPLGAGALAGSTLPLDPAQTAHELGFSSSFGNSYDVVGDRDFVLELLQVASQFMIHVSRLGEDFIYFCSSPVAWIELPSTLCTGSSMMPQKMNPDLLELARGKAASVLGHTHALAALLKGLPTSYHRDLQQDKDHLFATVDLVSGTLSVLPPLILGFQVNQDRCRSALRSGYVMATDLAEYLVQQGTPFREAHRKVGKLVAFCSQRGLALEDLELEQIRHFAPESSPDVLEVLDPDSGLKRRRYPGSAGLKPVEEQIQKWQQWLMTQMPSEG